MACRKRGRLGLEPFLYYDVIEYWYRNLLNRQGRSILQVCVFAYTFKIVYSLSRITLNFDSTVLWQLKWTLEISVELTYEFTSGIRSRA